MKKPLAILIVLFSFLSAQETTAVIEFEGNGVSDFEVTALTDRFRDEVVKLGSEIVVERGKMEEVLKEQAFQQTGCTFSECAVEVGKLLSVQKIIIGSISKVGNLFSVSCRLVSVETGEILKVTNFDYDGEIGDLLKFGMKESVYQLFDLVLPEGEKRIATSKPINSSNSQYGKLELFNNSYKTLYLDGAPVDTYLSSDTYELLPGNHRISYYSDEEIREAIEGSEAGVNPFLSLVQKKDIFWVWAVADQKWKLEKEKELILNNTKTFMIQPGEIKRVHMTWKEGNSKPAKKNRVTKNSSQKVLTAEDNPTSFHLSMIIIFFSITGMFLFY